MHPILFFLKLQSNIKLYHWLTKAYPRHVASDKFVDSILEHGDKFVEVYIGRYGRPKLVKKDLEANTLALLNDDTVLNYFDSIATYLTTDITKYIKPEDTDLLNIRDELLADVHQTKYLFTLN